MGELTLGDVQRVGSVGNYSKMRAQFLLVEKESYIYVRRNLENLSGRLVIMGSVSICRNISVLILCPLRGSVSGKTVQSLASKYNSPFFLAK